MPSDPVLNPLLGQGTVGVPSKPVFQKKKKNNKKTCLPRGVADVPTIGPGHSPGLPTPRLGQGLTSR